MKPVMLAVVVATLTAPSSILPRGLMMIILDMFSENCSRLATTRDAEDLTNTPASVSHGEVSVLESRDSLSSKGCVSVGVAGRGGALDVLDSSSLGESIVIIADAYVER